MQGDNFFGEVLRGVVTEISAALCRNKNRLSQRVRVDSEVL